MKTIVNAEKECIQEVTHDGQQVVKVTQLILHFINVYVKHPLLIVNKIAHKLIVENDFLTLYKSDLLNTAKAIVFRGSQVSYTLFMSTVNSICWMICSTTATIRLYEIIALSALLDANALYATN